MLKVLLVDDEPMIVDGLYEFIHKRKEDTFELLRAYTASKTLELFKSTRIDILVTDIEMPGIGGLELQQQVELLYPHCRTIFWTAHDQFEYVYHAAQKANVSLLLKSDGFEKMLTLLETLAAEIQNSLLDKTLLEALKEQSEAGLYLSRQNFFINLLSEPEENLSEAFGWLKVPLKADRMIYPVLLCVRTAGSTLERQRRMALLEAYMRYQFERMGYKLLCIQVGAKKLLFLIQIGNESAQASEQIEHMMDLLLSALSDIAGCEVVVGMGHAFIPWERLGDWYHSLDQVSQLHSQDDDNLIYMLNDNDIKQQELGKLCATVQEAAANGNKNTLHDGLSKLYKETVSWEDRKYFLLNVVQELIKRVRVADVNETINLQTHIFSELNEPIGVDAAARLLMDSARQLGERQDESNNRKNERVLRMIEEYLLENYMRNISLTDVAECVYMSAAYVSRLYKRMTGIGIIDRLQSIRLNKGRELLMNTNMKVRDIAMAIGYDSDRYFISVFRKNYGLSPEKYRKQ